MLSMIYSSSELEFIKNNYLQLSHLEISKNINRSKNSVRNVCHKNGWLKKEEPWGIVEDDILKTLYEQYADILDLDYIGYRLDRTKASIACRANELGITFVRGKRLRTEKAKKRLSEQAKERWNLKPNIHFIKNHEIGRKLTEEAKKKMSKASTGRKKTSEQIKKMMATRYKNGWSPSSINRSWKAGKADDLGNIHFRSRWERNYARYLNYLIKNNQFIKWEYEVDIFWFEKIKRGVVSYKPDFKVYNLDGTIEYHEVKGWMDDRSKTKIKRMAKYYPQVKLYIIDSKIYKDIKNKLSRLIEYWEND